MTIKGLFADIEGKIPVHYVGDKPITVQSMRVDGSDDVIVLKPQRTINPGDVQPTIVFDPTVTIS